MRLNTPSCRRGFTLVEVLVVVAIIMTLAAASFVAVGKMTMAAHKAGSVSDIKQLSVISTTGAADNNNIFPQAHFVTENGGLPFWFSWEWNQRWHRLQGWKCSTARLWRQHARWRSGSS